MNILFLDFDGVVNNSDLDTTLIRIPNTIEHYVEELASNVNKLINEFNFKVVISSAWRLNRTKEH